MSDDVSAEELEAYLDEALPPAEMARVEDALRRDEAARQKLASVHARRDDGEHSLGEIWRRHRLTCPAREQLGGFLMDTLSADEADYIRFHIETVGCRYCQANLIDLRARQSESNEAQQHRRRKYFQSSAGYLPHDD